MDVSFGDETMPRPLTLREGMRHCSGTFACPIGDSQSFAATIGFSPRCAPKEDTDGARLGLASIRHCSSHPFDLSVRTDYAN
jgi:hypothetical protein